MTQKQPLYVRVIEEMVIFLAFVGGVTVAWLIFDGGQDWWRRAAPSMLWAYPMRFLGEYWARKQGRPILRIIAVDTVRAPAA